MPCGLKATLATHACKGQFPTAQNCLNPQHHTNAGTIFTLHTEIGISPVLCSHLPAFRRIAPCPRTACGRWRGCALWCSRSTAAVPPSYCAGLAMSQLSVSESQVRNGDHFCFHFSSVPFFAIFSGCLFADTALYP